MPVVENNPELEKQAPTTQNACAENAGLSMQGQLLNVYIGSNSKLNVGYAYTDLSGIKVYSNYPLYVNNSQMAKIEYYNQTAINNSAGKVDKNES